MIKEIKLYFKLRPILKQLTTQFQNLEKPNVKLSVNAVIQICGTLLQVVNALGVIFPQDSSGQRWILAAGAAIQGIVGVLAHFSNPDGTSAKTAYETILKTKNLDYGQDLSRTSDKKL